MRHAPAAILTALLLAPGAATGQSTLERSPLLGQDWVGFPWAAELSFIDVVDDPAGRGLDVDPAYQAALGLPRSTLIGVRFAPEPTGSDGLGPSTVEGFARMRLSSQDTGAPLDLTAEALAATAEGDWAATAGLHAGRWFGPLRLMGMAELEALNWPQVTVGGGALWHALPGRAPIALAADVATVAFDPARYLDNDIPAPGTQGGPDLAWSAGLQVGLSFTTHTLSIYATNAHTTARGQHVGSDRVRLGIEVTAPVPVGRFFGAHVPRRAAMDAVRPVEPGQAEPGAADATADARADVVVVPIREYRYAPQRLVIEVGTTVEWVNEDDVMHTASADDAAWNSGAIPPGQRWSATFEEPGTYPYHCGPHPFMRGVVVVR